MTGGGLGAVVKAAAWKVGDCGFEPTLAFKFQIKKMFLPRSLVMIQYCGEVACSFSDRQCSNFESCVWRAVSSHSSHHPQEDLLARFSLYMHTGGLKPHSFSFQGAIAKYAARSAPIARESLACCFVILHNKLKCFLSLDRSSRPAHRSYRVCFLFHSAKVCP